jgi:hypothetical protein
MSQEVRVVPMSWTGTLQVPEGWLFHSTITQPLGGARAGASLYAVLTREKMEEGEENARRYC